MPWLDHRRFRLTHRLSVRRRWPGVWLLLSSGVEEHARNTANGYHPDVVPNVLGDAGLRCLDEVHAGGELVELV